jgi:outer membrane receptor for ferric coprogen and ferric-rhodotorulic acid
VVNFFLCNFAHVFGILHKKRYVFKDNNAALYYRLRHLQVQANLNNVFNRTYWVGGYDKLHSFPGAPRNINLTVTYGF